MALPLEQSLAGTRWWPAEVADTSTHAQLCLPLGGSAQVTRHMPRLALPPPPPRARRAAHRAGREARRLGGIRPKELR